MCSHARDSLTVCQWRSGWCSWLKQINTEEIQETRMCKALHRVLPFKGIFTLPSRWFKPNFWPYVFHWKDSFLKPSGMCLQMEARFTQWTLKGHRQQKELCAFRNHINIGFEKIWLYLKTIFSPKMAPDFNPHNCCTKVSPPFSSQKICFTSGPRVRKLSLTRWNATRDFSLEACEVENLLGAFKGSAVNLGSSYTLHLPTTQ